MNVIGWKCWAVDPADLVNHSVIVFRGTVHTWDDVPDTVLMRMLYYDQMSVDGTIRYRQMQQGSDLYFYQESSAIYGHNSGQTVASVLETYPGAVVREGIWTGDELYGVAMAEAMADHNDAGMT